MSEVNLENAEAHNAIFEGADLTNANLTELKGGHANFQGAKLSGAKLIKAHLVDASLQMADLKNAYLSGSNLERANLTDAVLENADLKEAILKNVIALGANFSKTNLAHANFGGADLKGAVVEGADLNKADFTKADLTGANLRSVQAQHANFSHSKLDNANLSDSNLESANFEETSLMHSNLSGVELKNANFMGSNLSQANLSKANLYKVNFSGAVLAKANLSESALQEANLAGANLAEADLSGADLSGADLATLFMAMSGIPIAIEPQVLAVETSIVAETPVVESALVIEPEASTPTPALNHTLEDLPAAQVLVAEEPISTPAVEIPINQEEPTTIAEPVAVAPVAEISVADEEPVTVVAVAPVLAEIETAPSVEQAPTEHLASKINEITEVEILQQETVSAIEQPVEEPMTLEELPETAQTPTYEAAIAMAKNKLGIVIPMSERSDTIPLKPEAIGTSSLADILGLNDEMQGLPSPEQMEVAKRSLASHSQKITPLTLGETSEAKGVEKPQRMTTTNPKPVKLPPETEERKKARHTARGLVSQMFASNRKLVQESLRKGIFYESMKEQLASAHKEYERQVSRQIREEFDYFQLELDVRIQAMKKEIN